MAESGKEQEFGWVREAREFYPGFPDPSGLELIGDRHVLCPEGEYV